MTDDRRSGGNSVKRFAAAVTAVVVAVLAVAGCASGIAGTAQAGSSIAVTTSSSTATSTRTTAPTTTRTSTATSTRTTTEPPTSLSTPPSDPFAEIPHLSGIPTDTFYAPPLGFDEWDLGSKLSYRFVDGVCADNTPAEQQGNVCWAVEVNTGQDCPVGVHVELTVYLPNSDTVVGTATGAAPPVAAGGTTTAYPTTDSADDVEAEVTVLECRA